MRVHANGITVRFGPIEPLVGVDLAIAAGETVGLMGPNGSGKTTLLDVISGLVRLVTGEVTLDSLRATGCAPDAIARLGVGRCFQTPRLGDRMTVLANARLGQQVLSRAARDRDEPLCLLERFGLADLQHRLAGELTPAARRRLEVVRALLGRPRLLLLDEPCSGLAAAETEEALELLEWAARERTLVIVEHRIPVLRRICGRIVVLDRGQIVADGDPEMVLVDRAVVEAYLGRRR